MQVLKKNPMKIEDWTQGWYLTCHGKKVTLDSLNEGGMSDRDGAEEYQGSCEVCSKSFYLKVYEGVNNR